MVLGSPGSPKPLFGLLGTIGGGASTPSHFAPSFLLGSTTSSSSTGSYGPYGGKSFMTPSYTYAINISDSTPTPKIILYNNSGDWRYWRFSENFSETPQNGSGTTIKVLRWVSDQLGACN